MSTLKKIILIIGLTLALPLMAWGARQHDSHGSTPAAGTEQVADEVGHAASAHAEHVEIDERLVPIPPSKDTMISAAWVLVIFIILLIVLYPAAWKPVLAGLKNREARIRSDLGNADRGRQRGEAALKRYNEQIAAAEARIRDMLSASQAEGEKLATNIRMQAQTESEEAKERATREIETNKADAVRGLNEQIATLATSIASKVIRRDLDVEQQRDLVRG